MFKHLAITKYFIISGTRILKNEVRVGSLGGF